MAKSNPTGSVRLLVETERGGNAGKLALRDAVSRLGGPAEPWRIERLFRGDDQSAHYFIVSADPAPPLTPQQVFDLGYRLAAEPGIRQVEPDLPVDAYWMDDEDAPPPPSAAFRAAPPSREDLDWARRSIRCDDAWALQPEEPTGRRLGEGILIGHPDTGYTRHWALGPELAALDLVHDRDFVDDDDDAEDPLQSGFVPLTHFAAHGTGTSSVIVGRGEPDKGIVGVAPGARLVPLRAVNSVIQFFDSDVARAVDAARLANCHVVSMSLGGKGFFGLYDAIQRAVDSGMIVMAAAGNKVKLITAPASYDNCIAVAATGRDDTPWTDSSRGKKVEISAPGSEVLAASWALKENPMRAYISQHHGTSYAVAHVAGAAALWLAFHGEAAMDRYGGRVAAAFRRVLHDHGHRGPAAGTWDGSRFGVGILDAHALLKARLPDPSEVRPSAAFAPAPAPPQGAERIAAVFGELDVDDVQARLARTRLAPPDRDRFAAEILYHLLTDRRSRESFVEAPVSGSGAFAPPWITRLQARASAGLAEAVD